METITQTELFEWAIQYAVRYGGCKTTDQLELLRRAAGRLSGMGDIEAVRGLMASAVDRIMAKQESVS